MKRAERDKMPTKLTTLANCGDAGDVRSFTTPQERWEMMWELSQSAYAFKGKKPIESKLNRKITKLIRRKNSD